MSGFTYTINLKVLGAPALKNTTKAVVVYEGAMNRATAATLGAAKAQQGFAATGTAGLLGMRGAARRLSGGMDMVTGSTRRATAAVGRLRADFGQTERQVGRTIEVQGRFLSEGERGMDGAARATRRTNGWWRRLRTSIRWSNREVRRFRASSEASFATAHRGAVRLIGVLGGAAAGYSAIQEASDLESMETALNFATAGEGAVNMQFLEQTSEQLKLSMRSSLPAFKSWMGAVRGTSLEGQEARNTFYAVAEASRVMGLSNEQNSGVFMALGQMASKGKVSAEELRQQLGERLPGALGIAARAMGVTQAELNDMMDRGELYSDVFLPKFARQLHKEFAGGVDEALGTSKANFADLDNSVLELQQSLGGGLIPMGTSLINNFLIPATDWLGKNGWLLVTLGSLYMGAAVRTGVFAVAQAWAATSGTVFTRVMQLLNVTLGLNPVGAVVMGITALVTAIAFAYNASDVWRGRLTGTWAVLKQTGWAILKYLVLPIRIVAKLFRAALTFDLDEMKSALRESFDLVRDNMNDFGSIGQKYGEGYAHGVASFNARSGGKGAAPRALSAEFGGIAGRQAFSAIPSAFAGQDGVPAGQVGFMKAYADGPAAAGDEANDGQVRRGLAGISGGGGKNITINIDRLVETIAIHAATAREGVDDMADRVLSKLLQSLNQAQQLQ